MKIVERWRDEGIIVVKPHVSTKKAPGDPYGDACEIAEKDWEGEFGAKSLVWDTMTWRSKQLLVMAASLKKYGDNIQFGKGGRVHVMPQRGDYGAAQSMCQDIRQLLFAHEDLHLFVLGHQAIAEIENDNNVVTAMAGFGLVGKASISQYGDIFNQYFRMYVTQQRAMIKGQESSRDVMLQLTKGPLFDAGIRTTVEVPDAVRIPHDLSGQREVWRDLERYTRTPLDGSRGFWRSAWYGPPKVGKTQFLTSIPDEAKPLVYVADDPGSEHLPSTHLKVLGEDGDDT